MNQEEKALRTNIRHLIQNVKAKKANKNKKMQELVGTLVQHELKAMMLTLHQINRLASMCWKNYLRRLYQFLRQITSL